MNSVLKLLCLRLQFKWENKGIFILFNVHENELVDAILTHWIVIFVWNIVMLLNQKNGLTALY